MQTTRKQDERELGTEHISRIVWFDFHWHNEMANNSLKESPVEPNERMRNLTKFGNTVDVDPNVPLKR